MTRLAIEVPVYDGLRLTIPAREAKRIRVARLAVARWRCRP